MLGPIWNMPQWFGILSRIPMPKSLTPSSRSLRPSVSVVLPSCSLSLYFCAKSTILRKRRHHIDALFLFRFIVALNPAVPSWEILVFVFLPAFFFLRCLPVICLSAVVKHFLYYISASCCIYVSFIHIHFRLKSNFIYNYSFT
jgi:hypothetical protein